MAIDETWAREVAAGTRQPTIRLWEWAGPAVVIGRFQSAQDEVNLDIAKQLGFDVVRRCTGGGAMFIEPGSGAAALPRRLRRRGAAPCDHGV